LNPSNNLLQSPHSFCRRFSPLTVCEKRIFVLALSRYMILREIDIPAVAWSLKREPALASQFPLSFYLEVDK
jgi:hypothetical protein